MAAYVSQTSNQQIHRRKTAASPEAKLCDEFQNAPEKEKPIILTKKESPYSLVNFLWLFAAVAVLYYTNIAFEAFTDLRVNRWWFNIGCLLIGVNVSICMFLIFYVTYYKKVDSELWEEHYPSAIPVATGAFVLGSLCLNVALWPIWSWLTPVFLFVLLMGVVVLIAMIPPL